MNKLRKARKAILSVAVFGIVAVLMAIYLPYNTFEADAAKTVTDADIQAVRDQIKINESKIAQYQADMEALSKDIEDAVAAKAILDQMISQIETNLSDTETLIAKYEQLITEKEEQISNREKQISQQYSDFLQRLRISYEDGSQNYLELLVSSENLIDFMTRIDNLGSVLSYEQTLMQELEQEVSDLNAMKTSLAQKKSEYEDLGVSMSESQTQLDEKLSEAEALIDKLEKDQDAAQKAYQNSVKQDAALDKELEELIKKQEEQQQAAAKGKFLWPVDSNYRTISSKYGWRVLWGEDDFHLGIDIPVPYGYNIYAANDGKVIKAQYHSSYGYYILIDHGGEISTLYAHCSKLLVQVGDKVQRGQVIAKIGATGSASGYHLHFEIRLNGKTTDPLKDSRLVINYNGKEVDPVANKLLKILD